MTPNERELLSEYMTVVEIYGPATIYYNKFGDIIQDWDVEGQRNAARTGVGEKHIYTIYANDIDTAMKRVEFFKNYNEVTRICVL